MVSILVLLDMEFRFTQTPSYYSYSIDNINYIVLLIPSPMKEIAEVHECQFDTWNQRIAAIGRLEKICYQRWNGPGCEFGEKSIG